uniref:Glycosyltransferase family 1 protein n=1 Tax=Desulfobacca acetoxidans TaxID=60893 RepID=A0A7V6A5Y3_9BACT
MRILVLNYEFPPIGGGGGRFSADLCRHLARFGHEVRVQTSRIRGLPAREVAEGYEIRRSWSGRSQAHTCTVPEMAWYLAANLVPSLRQAASWRPQVINVHFAVPTGVLAWMIRRLTGIPYVLSAQLGDVPGGVPVQTDHLFRWVKPFTIPIWRDAAALTVPSGEVAELVQRAYHLTAHVIPNGVELAALHPRPPEVHHPVRLVFVGRFSPQKNLLFLLAVLGRLRDLDWRLDLVGDGPVRKELEDLSRRLDVAARIHFHGWVTPEAATAVLRDSDILVMPSLSEGLSLVGLQALGLGLALAVSDHGGMKDLVAGGVNGFACPATDIPAFAGRLRDLLTNRPRLLAMKRASLAIAPRFEAGSVARQMEQLLLRAAGRCSAGDHA